MLSMLSMFVDVCRYLSMFVDCCRHLVDWQVCRTVECCRCLVDLVISLTLSILSMLVDACRLSICRLSICRDSFLQLTFIWYLYNIHAWLLDCKHAHTDTATHRERETHTVLCSSYSSLYDWQLSWNGADRVDRLCHVGWGCCGLRDCGVGQNLHNKKFDFEAEFHICCK